VHENEQIRDELWAVIYGIWNYIKNSGKFDADHMTLEWVGSLPGKREYRRFLGDYVLNQNDVVAQELFEDRIAFGGWSIDLHPPQGMYAEESGSKHLHLDGSYHIPFRSLYSSNVNNLMFAGRDISATHVAFGTTRVMATCAVMGEAAGTGAALCVREGVKPRELHQLHLHTLQQTLLQQDGSVIGLRNQDSRDLSIMASLQTSSTLKRIQVERADQAYGLNNPIGILIPVDPRLDGMELLLDAVEDTQLTVELWSTGKKENYIPSHLITEWSIQVAAGSKQWVHVPIEWQPDEPSNAFIIVRRNSHIRLYLSEEPLFGVLGFENKLFDTEDVENYKDVQKVVAWSMFNFNRKIFCMRVFPETAAYGCEKITDGYSRPYGGPHVWISERMTAGQEEWIHLAWNQQSVDITEIQITFNDDVNEDLINLHHHITPFDVIPELVKDYRVEAWIDGQWAVLLTETNNRKRKRVHRLHGTIQTNEMRIVIQSTNGCPTAQIVEVRVY